MFWWRSEVRPGVWVAFTDAGAGNLALHVDDDQDEVLRRRELLEAEVGFKGSRFQYMNQVHGSAVAVIRKPTASPTADAMVSLGLPLAVMVADCVPVALVGETEASQPVLGVAHAGRPGVASGVVPGAVAAMRAAGATTIRAWIGPSICGSCYEVPGDLRAEVAGIVPATASTTSWGTPALDLPAGVRSQLAGLGVTVEYSGPCTLEQGGLFSYRRDKQTGRLAGLVWIND